LLKVVLETLQHENAHKKGGPLHRYAAFSLVLKKVTVTFSPFLASLGAFIRNLLAEQFSDKFCGAFIGGKGHRQELILSKITNGPLQQTIYHFKTPFC
jgi:hypothetical protein